jgi:hypothetical protein
LLGEKQGAGFTPAGFSLGYSGGKCRRNDCRNVSLVLSGRLALYQVTRCGPVAQTSPRDGAVHAAELETEMLGRRMMIEVIDWSEDQATPPFEE